MRYHTRPWTAGHQCAPVFRAEKQPLERGPLEPKVGQSELQTGTAVGANGTERQSGRPSGDNEMSPNGGRIQVSFAALTVGRGSMESHAKVNRTLGLVVLLVGSILPGRAQLSKNAPASVSQIQDEIKQHPNSPKRYVALSLAY